VYDWSLLGAYSLRLAVAAALGVGLGIQRETEGHSAGPRTYALVAIGSALFTVAGESYGANGARIAAQIVTGIGFLGAGTIMRQGNAIRGLTTAASLWATAGVGLACGRGGLWLALAVFTFVIMLLLLGVGKMAERRLLHGTHVRDLSFTASQDDTLARVVSAVEDARAAVERITRSRLSAGQYRVRMNVVFSSQREEYDTLNALGRMDDVNDISMAVSRRAGDRSP
jgi:putative Mg2+ transporter-C (MgtC) family protein